MNRVEEARRRWIDDRSEFSRFGNVVTERLRRGLRKLGISADVTTRSKDLDSLVKKLILKPDHSYESVPDKVGVRVVHKFRCNSERVRQLISEQFDHELPDDKASMRGASDVGYLSVHIDRTRLKGDDPVAIEFPPETFFAEVQLRTQAQHLWAEMAHDDVYKNDTTVIGLSSDLKRRVHLMAGQIEVADREFDLINRALQKDPTSGLLKALERNYYTLTSRRGNPELSLAVIKLLLPLFGAESQSSIIERLNQTFREHETVLEHVYQDPDRGIDPSAFFFQPEALMIYDRLLYDRDETLRVWNSEFPPSELELVATNFGISLH